MGLFFGRREFLLGASSLGSLLVGEGLSIFDKVGVRNDSPPLPASAVVPQQNINSRPPRPRVLVFDVNQTLLDLGALRPQFARVFGDGKAFDEWFSLLLQYSLVVTVANAYSDFGTVGGAVLEMLASTKGVRLSPEDKTRILQGVLQLPAHPDVPENLKRLQAAGFRMVTLTNSSSIAVKAQLQNAGLTQYFDESISVDSVHRFKPDLEVYRSAAAHLNVQPTELRLIAAHAWDVFGAMKAGWQAAFVARNGIALFPLGPMPDIIGADMKAVADRLLTN
jgi:2-haloacid dehalogenase